MANKPNPFLAAFEAKKEAEFAGRLAAFEAQKEAEFVGRLGINSEVNMIATLIAGSDLGFIAEKRADLLLAQLVETKMQIAQDLLADVEHDKEMTYTRADLARRLKQILGRDGWIRCREMFPLLRDYWDD